MTDSNTKGLTVRQASMLIEIWSAYSVKHAECIKLGMPEDSARFVALSSCYSLIIKAIAAFNASIGEERVAEMPLLQIFPLLVGTAENIARNNVDVAKQIVVLMQESAQRLAKVASDMRQAQVFRVESRQLTANIRKLRNVAKNFGVASNRVMRSSARGARTETVRAAILIYNVGRNRLSPQIFVGDFNSADLSFVVSGSRYPISLLAYGAKATRSGLNVVVIKSNGRKTLPTGFIANSPGGARLPWRRVPGAKSRRMTRGRYAGRLRKPIEALLGPSASDMIANPKVTGQITIAFFERTTREILRVIDSELRSG